MQHFTFVYDGDICTVMYSRDHLVAVIKGEICDLDSNEDLQDEVTYEAGIHAKVWPRSPTVD